MALVTRRKLYPCEQVGVSDCANCKYEDFCVCDGVSYKGVDFIDLGPVEYHTLGYRDSPIYCSKVSASAGHLRWRFIKGLPHEGFLLIQKVVRKAGQNLFKIGDKIYWQPVDSYTVEIDDDSWHECLPELGRKYIGDGTYVKISTKE